MNLLCLFQATSCAQLESDAQPAASTLAVADEALAPIRSPLEEQQTFQLASGFRCELVAAEPQIQDPVAIAFDPDGRMWVCEMRGFMPDIDGQGEDLPVGVISVLEDTNSDGRMDRQQVFLDGLVLPRGLCWTTDGLLVCENGTIWLCRDTNGDFRCDSKLSICTYNPGNLEHSLNGLMPAMDNWIYNAKEGIRLRRTAAGWISQPYASRGQWGMTQDDYGYLYYNVNASLLRGDLVPCYSPIAQSDNPLVDVELFSDQTVYPLRPNRGINRGYIPGFLRDDGSLREANSNCGPVVYRGNALPTDLLGNVFIPEPAGNLIRRQIVSQGPLLQKNSFNAYHEREFLASTDERFRPVNMFNGPDGGLYIVDMYRGIIQHGAFMTSYLRQQILQRKLETGVHMGRIWRITHANSTSSPQVHLSDSTTEELVRLLSHDNGWHRDMAQRLLVEQRRLDALGLLEDLVLHGESPIARLHALWTLEGLGRIDPDLLYDALGDPDMHVRASATVLYRRFLKIESMQGAIVEDFSQLQSDENLLIKLQLVQALGLLGTDGAERLLTPLLQELSETPEWLLGSLGGFRGRELEFVATRLQTPHWHEESDWRKRWLTAAARGLWQQYNPVLVLRFCQMLNEIPATQDWQKLALLQGIQDRLPRTPRNRFPPPPGETPVERRIRTPQKRPALKLPEVPAGLETLCASENPILKQAAQELANRLFWPGKDGRPLPVKPALSAEQRQLLLLGSQTFRTVCAGCHQDAGYGLEAKGPPLVGSSWLEQESRLIRILLHGLEGPIHIYGEKYNIDSRLSMPAMSKTLTDEQIAGVATWVRRTFLEEAGPVAVGTVQEIRAAEANRISNWTEEDLREVPPH